MGIRIIGGDEGDVPAACLYQSTANVAFGPVFPDAEAAEEFLDWFRAQGHPDRYLIDNAKEIYEREYLPAKAARAKAG